MNLKNIMIAGAGILGSQIAYQTALKGFNVTIYNRHKDTAEKRLLSLKELYQNDIKLSEDEFNKGMENITITTNIEKAIHNADLIIEALPEVLDTPFVKLS